MKEQTVTVYRCGFCNKPYFRKKSAHIHELRCGKNPTNYRPCFDCKHLSQDTVDQHLEDPYFGSSSRKVVVFVCTTKEIAVYPPQVEMKRNELIDLSYDGKELDNEPMPHVGDCNKFKRYGY